MTTQKILVVDDAYKILIAVRAYLEREGFEVVTCTNGKEAMNLFAIQSFDCYILDLMLPDVSGEMLCTQIRQFTNAPILMLTAKSDEESMINGLKIGADDFMTKPFSPRQLVARVQALLRRAAHEKVIGPIYQFRNEALVIHEMTREVFVKQQLIKLTPIEYKLLLHFVKNTNTLFNREALIQQVLDEPMECLDRIIDNHIKNLRQKIEEDPKNPSYIQTVYGLGYRFMRE